MARKKVKRVEGDIIAIPLNSSSYGYGRVLREPLVAFYDAKSTDILPVDKVLTAPIAFVVFTMNYPIIDGLWPVIGHEPLSKELLQEPLFCKKDALSGKLTIYRDSTGEEFSATLKECEKLEIAAVWEAEHIEDRLRDHFAGQPNKWVQSLRQ